MQPSGLFKQSLLKHMLACLRAGGVSTSKMSILERKRAIKLSADAAMALARGGSNWSRTIISNLTKLDHNSSTFINGILRNSTERLQKQSHCTRIIRRSKKILRRSARNGNPRGHPGAEAGCVAKRMRMKRTQVLKALVPGGNLMKDELSLLGEALDYVVSLQAQVDVLQRLTSAVELLNGSSFLTSIQQGSNESCTDGS